MAGANVQTFGRVRGGNLGNGLYADGDDQSLRLNGRGDALFAPALLAKAELVRMGGSYSAAIPTGSAFTTVAAWPTTRSELYLGNAETAGGRSYVIDQIWAATIVTETAATELTIIYQMSAPGIVALPANNTAVLVNSLSGKPNYGGKAQLALGSTAFAVANKWQVVAGSPLGGASVSVGQAVLAEVQGQIIVPPGATLCLNAVVGTAVAAAGIMGVVWHEVALDLGA